MRILVVGDLHARAAALHEFRELSNAVVETVEGRRPDRVVLAGDLLNDHANVHTAALNAVLELIDRLRRLVPVHVLIGNHDLPSNQSFLEPSHAFNALKQWNGVTVVDDVTALDDGRFLFLPFVPSGRFVEALDQATAAGKIPKPWLEAQAIFAHQDFVGARMGEIVVAIGERWRKDYPLLVSGHVHQHQWVRKNLCYVGAPTAHAFGETTDHTVSLFTFDDSTFAEERLSLGLPRRLTVELDLEAAKAYVPPPGDLIRLIVRAPAPALIGGIL